MAKRKRENWKRLTREELKKIVKQFEIGVKRNQILREHHIPAGQFLSIIRKTAKRI